MVNVGDTYGNLKVIKEKKERSYNKKILWICRCECGGLTEVTTHRLKREKTTHCGCKGNKRKKRLKKLPKDVEGIECNIMEEGLLYVFKNGRVFAKDEEGYLEANYNRRSKRKYKSVTVTLEGKQKGFYLHRLLAESFIPNPENKSTVTFKDEDIENVTLDNLKWVTPKEVVRKGSKDRSDLKDCILCGHNKVRDTNNEGMCGECKKKYRREIRLKNKYIDIKEDLKGLYNKRYMLTEKQREAVEERIKGKTYQEIADEEGLSRQSIENRIINAKKRVECYRYSS